MFETRMPVTIAGAGSIGCYAGGCLALTGRNVTLLARPRLVTAIQREGLLVVDLDGRRRKVASGTVSVTDDPALALRDAGIVLVTVKSGATEEMAGLIAAHARPDAIVLSLQNGVRNGEVLRSRLGAGRVVLAGMVPFNVVQATEGAGAPTFHRTTSGRCLIEAGAADLAGFLDVDGFPVGESDDMAAVLWGKLLLNLNNALNALSGLPLATQLADRRWRLLLADQIAEALAVMRKAGIKPARAGGPTPALLPVVLRLPDILFGLLARRMLAVDPRARSSMWDDLERGRPTEIDEFQGAIVHLAMASGADAPLSRSIAALVRAAEAKGEGPPGLAPEDVRAAGDAIYLGRV
ncbi:2-dehydropantoate 2-reductase [Mesorhizobium sp. L-8-3]|uniref:2-dehydropantoate 2-reductase n=1 Tax=Mesorhizobium sp. L-8-3 TaxID=2744522 RepID=UPI0019289BE5|nr:2-dehydropantoate 2-reductase [Mesorhizobium sp. L-8-3]BCH27927.1 2-dehydropantoate 2-reductase [Mesorhizobium sp. L-8-3]